MKESIEYASVIDVETTGYCPVGFSASPEYPLNKIVMFGEQSINMDETGSIDTYYPWSIATKEKDELDLHLNNWFRRLELKDITCIVGHNVAFDLAYIRNQLFGLGVTVVQWKEAIKNVFIWDTMIAEYLLYGKLIKSISLDELSIRYGLPLKPNAVKELWDMGTPTEYIDEDILKEYLSHDVITTKDIFKKQFHKVKEKNLEIPMYLESESIKVLLEMKYNGMRVDLGYLKEYSLYLETEISKDDKFLRDNLPEVANPNSSLQLSTFLFGGEKQTIMEEAILDEKGDVVLFKTGKNKGKPRYKNKVITTKVTPINPDYTERLLVDILKLSKTTTGYSVGDKTLKALINYEKSCSGVLVISGSKRILRWDLIRILEVILNRRKNYKLYNTYVTNMCDMSTAYGGFIHCNFNQSITATGRLSSSDPNLQNIPNE